MTAAAFFWLALALPLAAETVEAPGSAVPPSSADLSQCYAWALEQSETLHMQQEQIYQLEQQYRQVIASVLPNVSFNASQKYQDTSGSGSSSNSFFIVSPQPQVNFAASQPLFSGFREFAAMASYKHQGQAAELARRHAQTLLFQDVANAFYQTVSLEAQLANARSAVELTGNRVAELRRFEELGKSRHSEVSLVESTEASDQAQVESLKGQIDVSRELLSFLTGRDVSRTRLLDRIERIRSLDAEESVLGRAIERTDVRSLSRQVQAQEDQVKLAKGAWYPTVTASGNYYLKRIPLLQPVHWDATLSGSLPLFSGGGQIAGVRQAKSQLSQAQYNLELGLRQARSDVRRAYATLRSAVAATEAAERAYLKADETFRLELKEYRSGLVNNLDVLTAMNALVSAKTTFDQIVVLCKLDLMLLKASYEDLPR